MRWPSPAPAVTMSLSLASLLYLLLSSIPPTLQQPTSSSVVSKWIYDFPKANLTYWPTFNILLYDLEAVITSRYSSYSFIVVPCKNLLVLFLAIHLPSTSTDVIFLYSLYKHGTINPFKTCSGFQHLTWFLVNM